MSSTSPFYDGDLQSGIAKAIQESKAVVIFLRDENSESENWSQDLFSRQNVSDVLTSSAVVLRIDKDSQQEAFLSAFCKVDGYPSLVVITDGKLQAHIGPDMELDEITKKLEVLFSTEASESGSKEASTASEPIAANSTSQSQSTTESVTSQDHNPDSTPAPTSSSIPPPTAVDAHTDSLSTPPHANPSPSTSKGKGKARATDHGLSPPDTSLPSTAPPPRSASQLDWIEKQRQRQIEAKRERERIMAQIEADKVERRAKRLADQEAHSAHPLSTPLSPPPPHSRSTAAQTHLSIRLLDGTTYRTTLPSSATLASTLRPTLSAAHPALRTTAYTFKALAPPPSPAVPIETADEHRPLAALGLAPSAALVLAPVPHAAAAYERAAAPLQMPWTWLGGAVGAARAAVGGVAGAAAGWLGGAAPAERPAEEGGADGQGGGGGGGARVRTLADQRPEGGGEESNRWYNGNQLSFQGRDEDE